MMPASPKYKQYIYHLMLRGWDELPRLNKNFWGIDSDQLIVE